MEKRRERGKKKKERKRKEKWKKGRKLMKEMKYRRQGKDGEPEKGKEQRLTGGRIDFPPVHLASSVRTVGPWQAAF